MMTQCFNICQIYFWILIKDILTKLTFLLPYNCNRFQQLHTYKYKQKHKHIFNEMQTIYLFNLRNYDAFMKQFFVLA